MNKAFRLDLAEPSIRVFNGRAANLTFFMTTFYGPAAFRHQSGKRCPDGRSSTTPAQQHAPMLHASTSRRQRISATPWVTHSCIQKVPCIESEPNLHPFDAFP
jgi:hypothetical protein